MGTQKDEKGPAGRPVLLISLVALAVVAAFAFGRVFRETGTSFRLAAAAAAAVLLAAALERRHLALATLISAAGLVVAIGLFVFPETTRFGAPTPTTIRAALESLRVAGQTAAVEVAPAQSLPPLVLAAVTSIWAAAFASHVLATRARSPFLAILPTAALVGFASVVREDGARPLYVVIFLAAAMGVLFGDSLRRVGQWGPVTAWHQRSVLRFGSTTARGARRVAIASLAIAAFLPALLPGYGANGLLSLRGDDVPVRVSINPIVDVRPALLKNPAVELFSVRSDAPAYWRFLSLDTFTGRLWTSANLNASNGIVTSGGVLPGGSTLDPAVGRVVEQTFVFEKLAQPWLPAAFEPVSVIPGRGSIRYDPISSTIVAPSGAFPGYGYRVRSRQVVPSPEDLNSVTSMDGPDTARYTRLPASTPPQITTIAHSLTDDQPTIYRKILAVQQYLRTFRYDERVPPGHDVNHILYFLTRSRAGYCEQFAGSMAVLLRALGIPTRVAVGFTPGQFDPETGLWRVGTQNAHTWVEVLFPQFGWLAFEPTPSRNNPTATPYTQPAFLNQLVTGAITECEEFNANGSCAGGFQGSKPGPKKAGVKDPFGFEGPGEFPQNFGLPAGLRAQQAGTPIEPEPPWWRAGLPWIVLSLVALVLLGVPMGKSGRRRMKLARARNAADRVISAYEVMSDRAADVGVGRRQDETLAEYRDRLRRRVAFSDGHLDRLTDLTGLAAYSSKRLSIAHAEEAVGAGRRVTTDIRRSVGAVRRVAGWYRVERLSWSREVRG